MPVGNWGGARHTSATINILYRLSMGLGGAEQAAVRETIRLLRQQHGAPQTFEGVIWELAEQHNGQLGVMQVTEEIVRRGLTTSVKERVYARVYITLQNLGFEWVERGRFAMPQAAIRQAREERG